MIGPLCDSCDYYGKIWEKNYIKSGYHKCGECSYSFSGLVKLIFGFAWSFCSTLYCVFCKILNGEMSVILNILSLIWTK